ncbi:MAG: ATP-dependent sacrificial sulfur transferase LarE [Nanobdellota archaeon]
MKILTDLRKFIRKYNSLTVAFSGGVDSSLVAKVAYDTLGKKAKAVTIKTEFTSENDILNSINLAKEIGIKHKIIHTTLLSNPNIRKNTQDRCYLCKLNIISTISGKIIMDGTNSDDDPARPGIEAIKELGVISPLKELKIDKRQVRKIAHELGLTNHSLASNSCLATRIPFNENITTEKLRLIEKAEDILNKNSIHGCRARLTNDNFIIEMNKKYSITYSNLKSELKKELKKEIYEKWT